MKENHVQQLLEEFRSNRPIRAGSFIVTVYGDAIAPHGGSVWLGSLIRLLEPFGLNQRLVRTTVFRLVREEWLVARQIGRRSYYSLTESGRRRIDMAHPRIYAPVQSAWDGCWDLILLTVVELSAEGRRQLVRELQWLGFGVVSNGVLAHPSGDLSAARAVLQEAGVLEQAVLMRTRCLQEGNQPLRGLIASCWNLDELAQRYAEFLERFRPVWQQMRRARRRSPEVCFQVRTLLIHEYRRVLLRDPQLPSVLLPADWAGTQARLLCRNLYRLVQGPAEAHLMAALETAEGPLPEASPFYYQRFGGLGDVEADAAVG